MRIKAPSRRTRYKTCPANTMPATLTTFSPTTLAPATPRIDARACAKVSVRDFAINGDARRWITLAIGSLVVGEKVVNVAGIVFAGHIL